MVISPRTRVVSPARRRDRRRMPALLGRAKGCLDDRNGLQDQRYFQKNFVERKFLLKDSKCFPSNNNLMLPWESLQGSWPGINIT